jgi:hypothetical protein
VTTTRADLRRALEDLGRRSVPARSPEFVADLEHSLVRLGEGGIVGRERVSTSTKVDIRRSLETVATRAVPAPDAAFVADLERRLVARGPAARPEPVTTLTPRHARPRRLVPVTSVAAAMVAGLVLLGALSGWFGGAGSTSSRDLVLTAAVDTTVQLPDGHTVAGRAGLDLPDGAIVRTGPNGHAVAGKIELGPGLEAVVSDGHLELRAAGSDPTASGSGDSASTALPSAPPAGSSSGSSNDPSSPTPSTPPVVIPTVPTTPLPSLPITVPPVTVPSLDDVVGSLPNTGLFGSK